ncbi:hypothetical protein B0O41_0309 [Propionibacteriaceae bacterium ES.041]|uniref:hypothetical protein n=1 Tax=Enemella evansiae TaxID=2016499 RepID=UPI000B9771C3|nr:hypothetical protein [Enemella evansiae]OYO06751.1 hypothetical protein CGZ95_00225 [Enemella evansiae]PFG65544.1 hypothetical protein B0O41_0309 [Propionibacteriaceae bacterium ES.041]
MSHVYPRLPTSVARRIATDIIDSQLTPESAQDLVALSHPRAAPIATGGTPVTGKHLAQVREHVLQSINGIGRRASSLDIDLALGEALHTTLQCSRADSGSDGVWNFLTLVLLPDVALRRFPNPKMARLVGAGPRSVLRRTWLRHDVLGDLLSAGSGRLQEDELVGLTERTSMLRNRALVRAVAKEALRREDRTTEWSREFFKRVRWSTGPLLLEILPPDDLAHHVRAIADSVGGVGSTPTVDAEDPDVAHDGRQGPTVSTPTRVIPEIDLRQLTIAATVIRKYTKAHQMSAEQAEAELREMIDDFQGECNRWRNRNGRESVGRDQFSLQMSPDRSMFIGYSAGTSGLTWREHKLRYGR